MATRSVVGGSTVGRLINMSRGAFHSFSRRDLQRRPVEVLPSAVRAFCFRN